MDAQHPPGTETLLRTRPGYRARLVENAARSVDSYGLVLALIVMDYIAASVLDGDAWGRVLITVLLGLTLVIALHTSSVGRGLMRVGWAFLVVNTIAALVGLLVPAAARLSLLAPSATGLLLAIAPVVIVRRIAMHTVVTVETILGAMDVYLLFGLIFVFVFAGVAVLSDTPFFAGVPHATANQFLFFSYTTLTTVGYGNLVPAGAVGGSLAMVEAFAGQIYLVVIVARLVSLWGQPGPRAERRPPEDLESAARA